LVGHVGEADDSFLLSLRKRVQGSRFHLDSEQSLALAELDSRCGFPKRCVGRPDRAALDRYRALLESALEQSCKRYIQTAVFVFRKLVVARALITQSLFDQDKVGWVPNRVQLPGRCD
jgi:hypothetical protein